ncbi:MAG: hypothetical protein PHU25_17550 [Deltaproteobacteria bacterium]|nr:hypothetical protein [Deltaproteobacteria bacterium]
MEGGFSISVACEECIAEGDNAAVYPGAPDCCPGLTPIGCTSPESDGGICDSCSGAQPCTRCGNGHCGVGENRCNCPADCPG